MDLALPGGCRCQRSRAAGTFQDPVLWEGQGNVAAMLPAQKHSPLLGCGQLWGQLCQEWETGASRLPALPLPETAPALGSPTVGRAQRTLR